MTKRLLLIFVVLAMLLVACGGASTLAEGTLTVYRCTIRAV